MKTRKPTGAVPWPLILIEGGEKSGKTWAAVVLSASEKVGQNYWIDLGEGSADEYGAVPGADYLIVEHDGSYIAILEAVAEIHSLAQKALDAGEKPVVLVIDSMTTEWDWLKDWATERAKGSRSNKAKLARDPHAEIKVSTNYWNDANDRHRRLMRLLMTFPGIVVMTARGKEVAVIGDNGQPVEGQKDYRVEAHKTLAFDASCWVRMYRHKPAIVVGARSVHTGIRPGRDEPQPLSDDWTLEWLIFDALKCDPAKAHTRDLVDAKPERTPEQIRGEALLPVTGFDRLGELYQEAQRLGYESVIVPDERDQEVLLLDLIRRLGEARRAVSPATGHQHATLRSLWKAAGDFEDRDARLRFTSEIVGRLITESTELTYAEAEKVCARVSLYIRQNTPPAGEARPEGAGAAA
ncbi:hypothetical protein [Thermomonospora umbrina]|uniref:AAA domain-containing protein n=1 Tax=Thermomonospora umbrina TaxID=111806 RepID=A0A3D9SWE0_9ACTN|nr:hypothetical protein [Thermomonospora umbrina]REF00257.1 hypothetical protein DFJ69_5785 [Thermomonospora umbrina]